MKKKLYELKSKKNLESARKGLFALVISDYIIEHLDEIMANNLELNKLYFKSYSKSDGMAIKLKFLSKQLHSNKILKEGFKNYFKEDIII